jgi:4-amino-4-deoxy-L-arabinose transferase-like glycosyltransferase
MTSAPAPEPGAVPPTGDGPPWRAAALALLVAVLISFTGIFDHALWTPDEPRDAEIGRAMLAEGDWVVPKLAGEPFLEKPPLYWWVMAGTYRVFGVSDGVARSVSALAGLLTLMLLFDLMRQVANSRAALAAVLIAGTTFGFHRHFHRAVVDPWLALFVMLGYWAFVVSAYRDRETPAGAARPWAPGVVLLYVAGGLAFLVKGLIGPATIAAPVCAAILVERRWGYLRSWAHVTGLLLGGLLCAVWPLMLWQRGGWDLLKVFVIDNLVYRVAPPDADAGVYAGGHRQAAWYYLTVFIPMLAPWVLAAPAMVKWLKERRMPAAWDRRALIFLLCVFPVGALMLSVPGTKREVYLLPLYAPFAGVAAAWLAATALAEYRRPLDQWTQGTLIALLGLVGAASGMVLFAADRLPAVRRFAGEEFGTTPPVVWALVLLLMAGALWIGVAGLRRLLRGDHRAAMAAPWLAMLIACVGGTAIFLRADPPQNLHRMTAGLVELNAFATPVAGFRTDETTRGLVPFDTGRTLRDFRDPEDLARFMRENPSGKLLALERNAKDHLPQELRVRLSLIGKWSYGKRRVYCLYGFTPDAKTPPVK